MYGKCHLVGNRPRCAPTSAWTCNGFAPWEIAQTIRAAELGISLARSAGRTGDRSGWHFLFDQLAALGEDHGDIVPALKAHPEFGPGAKIPPQRRAVSAETARSPRRIVVTRFAGTRMARASWLALIPRACNSSLRTLPGCVRILAMFRPPRDSSRVVIFYRYNVRVAVCESKGNYIPKSTRITSFSLTSYRRQHVPGRYFSVSVL